ncbi:MAG: T9SS type A sorting domain-containing protein, partial [Saprospiraceae bacterium]
NGEVTISVYDITGKVYLKERKEMRKGYNEYSLDKSQLPNAGVYYYQVDYRNNTITKKMVIID